MRSTRRGAIDPKRTHNTSRASPKGKSCACLGVRVPAAVFMSGALCWLFNITKIQRA